MIRWERASDPPQAAAHLRAASLLLAVGWLFVSIGSAGGRTPSWPLPVVWVLLASSAAAAHLLFAVTLRSETLRFATLTTIVAAQARAVGLLLAGNSTSHWSGTLVGVGIWEMLVAYATIKHLSLRGHVR